MVELLIDSGADVDSKTISGTTALISAVGNGHMRVVKILLYGAANPNIQDSDGRTALFFAIKWHKRMVRLLLEWGADLNIRDAHGNTVLDHVSQLQKDY